MENRERRISKWRLPLTAVVLLILLSVVFARSKKNIIETINWNGVSFDVVRVESGNEIVMRWADSTGKPLGKLETFMSYSEFRGVPLSMAMNGGMYLKDQSPQGLYIENGVKHKSVNTDSAYGNFYLMPNGVFGITQNGDARVLTRDRFIKSYEGWRYATQSGPMLVINNTYHPAIRKGSSNVHIRNAVGVTEEGVVYFVISNRKTNFYTLASLFKERLNCPNALYLDGFVSKMRVPSEGRIEDGNFGVMIGVKK